MAMHSVERADALSAVFGALASPTRRAIIEQLSAGVRSVSEIAEPFGMSQPTISKHLKVLERAGLVSQGRDARWRPRALRAAPLREARDYLERFRKLWDDRLDRLELYLKKVQADRSTGGSR